MVCLFRHKWDGCKCRTCGKIRDTDHSWVGCVCEVCHKIGDTGHQLKYENGFLSCTVCGEKTACHEINVLNTAVGPVLQDGLRIKPILHLDLKTNEMDISGAEIFADNTKVLTVNEMGKQLLDMADGTITFDEMAKRLDTKTTVTEIHMFFVKLGQSGYLKNRVEITLYGDNHSVGGIHNEA